ncbi:EDSAP-1 family PEP-CTERM protein [Nitrosospira sp. Nsp1]|uniref:EDSAP-1 family PEP-CTERM protein n=1 Tax=Nitrosospira sp. Nsp1 TaxID=136547 RepID=UPI00088FDFF4|nr:EDSAP-1 family PEP-CTERM protein [Nitrosospira sp. Nsp1]SCX39332.1 PEP-CTERM protein-sorting domain-containing protein [Nitrosospira sp. Nsp1]
MKTKFKLLTLSASLLAGGLVLSDQAQAGAYAFSYNHIRDGFINVTGGTAVLTNSSSSTSTTGTPLPVTRAGDLVIGSAPNALPATQGGPVRLDETVGGTPLITDNGYTPFGRIGTSYSWADGNTRSEQDDAGGRIEVVNAAEGNIHDAPGSATSGAENSSNSILTMTADLPTGGTLQFTFEANPYLEAFIHEAGSLAAANLDNNITIRNDATGAVVFSWAPDGSPGGITGGTENIDSQSLNNSINDLIADGSAAIYSPGAAFTRFDAITNPLGAGAYTISLFTQESQVVDKKVPEPATLALVGLGMLGMSFFARRRKQA